jgi:hypothetical protein
VARTESISRGDETKGIGVWVVKRAEPSSVLGLGHMCGHGELTRASLGALEDAEEEHEDIGHAESETAVAKPPCGGIVWTYRQWVQVGQRRRKIVGLFDILCHWV